MKPFPENIKDIRTAVMASDVREGIAQGMEYVEQFANTATTKAAEAAASAKAAADAAGNASTAVSTAIDPTLSLSGKAADAKATGDRITVVKEALEKIGYEEITQNIDIIAFNGIKLTSTPSAVWSKTTAKLDVNEAYNHYIAINELIPVIEQHEYKIFGVYNPYSYGHINFYDANKAYISNVGSANSDPTTTTAPSNAIYLSIDCSSDIDISNIQIFSDTKIGKFKSDNVVLTQNQKESAIDGIPDKYIGANKVNFVELVQDKTFEDTVNIAAGITWSNQSIRDTSGAIFKNQYSQDYNASSFIPVVSEFQYNAYAETGSTLYCVFFNSEKNHGTSVKIGWVNTGDSAIFTVPKDAVFVSFNCEYNGGESKIKAVHRITQTNDEKNIVIPRLSLSDEILKPLYGKKIVNFGDSIFGQARPPVDISTFLANYSGATVYNAGFGGCQMTEHAQNEYKPFSMVKIADAIATNNWTEQEAAAQLTTVPDYFSDTVKMLKGLNFSDIDIVTIGYGINDFNNGAALSGGNNFNYFKYSMEYAIRTLLTAFVNLRIFVCTMTYGFSDSGDTNSFTKESWVDGKTTSYIDWVEMQKTVAKEFELPVIDNYYDLGINSVNKLRYFSRADGTHQNIEGRKLIAKHISKILW